MKKVFSTLLSLVLVISMLQTTAIKVSAEESYESITLGLYPQTRVEDEALISSLNNTEKEWHSFNYSSLVGEEIAISDYMQYADVTYEGEKYRAVKFSAYRPRKIIWPAPIEAVISNIGSSYVDDNGYEIGTTYWFKYEPLKWNCIDKGKGYYICTKVIDSQGYWEGPCYNKSSGYFSDSECTSENRVSFYVASNMRKWLNGQFLNTTFLDSEQKMLKEAELKTRTPYEGEDTSIFDKVFLITKEEFTQLGGEDVYNHPENPLRMADEDLLGTDYARVNGLWKNTNTNFIYCLFRNYGEFNTWYHQVRNDGQQNIENNTADGIETCYGVRPVICIDNNKIVHTHQGEKVDQIDSTCSSYGVKAYYKCSCGKYFTDSECKNEIADIDVWKNGEGRIDKKEHSYASTWATDGTSHWHECTVCGDKKDVKEHSYASTWTTDGTNHWHECTVCGEKKDVAVHTLETITTKATLSEDGKKETKCSVCDKLVNVTTICAASTIKLSTTTYSYDGKAKKPSVIVNDSNGNEVASTNYTVTYPSGRKNVGKYTVKITFKDDYSGKKDLSFIINPSKTTISKISSGKKAFTVKWSKKTTQVTGYQIQYSTKSDFKSGNKTVKVTSSKTVSKTIKNLKGKKKYYVRIRTYKTVGKTTYYSEWSAKKSVTTKK